MYLSSNHSRDVRKGKGNLGRRGGRTKTAAIRRKTSIPHDVFLETILPMMPQPAFEKRILKAVKTRNLRDLYGLVGRTATTVPSYLTCNANYTKVAGFSIMLPVLQKLGFQLGPNIFAAAAKKRGYPSFELVEASQLSVGRYDILLRCAEWESFESKVAQR